MDMNKRKAFYVSQIQDNFLPYWLQFVDNEYGGILNCINNKGCLLYTSRGSSLPLCARALRTAASMPPQQGTFMQGKVTLVGCPKLDSVDYSQKLTAILQSNAIQSVTVVRMASLTPVSYTHLDVYKRQLWLYPSCSTRASA